MKKRVSMSKFSVLLSYATISSAMSEGIHTCVFCRDPSGKKHGASPANWREG